MQDHEMRPAMRASARRQVQGGCLIERTTVCYASTEEMTHNWILLPKRQLLFRKLFSTDKNLVFPLTLRAPAKAAKHCAGKSRHFDPTHQPVTMGRV
jgi:hypothetical protein